MPDTLPCCAMTDGTHEDGCRTPVYAKLAKDRATGADRAELDAIIAEANRKETNPVPVDHLPHLSDDEVLSGLWWSEPEYPDWCGTLWREYVERKHAWNDYRAAVATVLRSANPTTENTP